MVCTKKKMLNISKFWKDTNINKNSCFISMRLEVLLNENKMGKCTDISINNLIYFKIINRVHSLDGKTDTSSKVWVMHSIMY